MSKRIIVTVSDAMNKTVESLAKDMGVSVPEYLRYLIMKAQEQERASEI